MPTNHDIDTILDAYIDCALWSSTDDNGEPLDAYHGPDGMAPAALAESREDIVGFLAYCEEQGIDTHGQTDEQIGHDFWLTRNGHGAGFWDRGLPNGSELSDACKPFGSVDLYIGDDGAVYVS